MPKPANRRTRGPRTPDERGTDAAKRTATVFDKLPATPFADDYLKPIRRLRYQKRYQVDAATDPGTRKAPLCGAFR
jgi:hypothetical protein